MIKNITKRTNKIDKNIKVINKNVNKKNIYRICKGKDNYIDLIKNNKKNVAVFKDELYKNDIDKQIELIDIAFDFEYNSAVFN